MLKITSLLLWLCSFPVCAATTLKAAPRAYDDYATITVGLQPSVSIDVASNDFFGGTLSIAGSTSGNYGQLSGNGPYTYTLYDNAANAALAADQVVTDIFTYTYSNDVGQSANARIIVQIKGNRKDPVAVDDNATVIVGLQPSIAIDVKSNDLYGSTAAIEGSTAGTYGYLTGSNPFTYTLYDNATNAALTADQVVSDTFTYTYANDSGQSTSAHIIIRVQGNQKTPVAVDDNATVIVGLQPSIAIDVKSNDLYGSSATLVGSTAGTYGYLTGNDPYTYTLYDNAANAALAADQIVTDTFTYTYANDSGQSTSAHITIQVQGNPNPPVAVSDTITVLSNNVSPLAGNVLANDKNATSVYLNSSPASKYGVLILNADGAYTYTLYKNAPGIIKLLAGEIVTDSFSYTSIDQYGQSAEAKLNVSIIGNPVDANGNTVFSTPNDGLYDNVDVEFNDRSSRATPVNSGRNIKGQLYTPGDKDWFRLRSTGNEIIKLEVCPAGSSCFGKKNWVLFVFDSKKLTPRMETVNYTFKQWLNATGSVFDPSGQQKLADVAGSSNALYLAYKQGNFYHALVGIIDPCFDTDNSVEVGVGSGARDYFIAVAAPLMGSTGKCGEGDVILQKPGISVLGRDDTGKAITYTTTQEYVSFSPYSDDQYTINITGTGLNPLLTTLAATKSASINTDTGELNLPKVRILDGLYEIHLISQNLLASGIVKIGAKFDQLDIKRLAPDVLPDAFQSTYNPTNQQVMIPRVTDTTSGKAYSLIMKYHRTDPPWMKVIAITPIQK